MSNADALKRSRTALNKAKIAFDIVEHELTLVADKLAMMLLTGDHDPYDVSIKATRVEMAVKKYRRAWDDVEIAQLRYDEALAVVNRKVDVICGDVHAGYQNISSVNRGWLYYCRTGTYLGYDPDYNPNGEQTEAEWLDELNRGYAQDRR